MVTPIPILQVPATPHVSTASASTAPPAATPFHSMVTSVASSSAFTPAHPFLSSAASLSSTPPMFEASHPTQAQVSQGAGTESPPGHSSEETEQRGYPDHESNTRALVGGAHLWREAQLRTLTSCFLLPASALTKRLCYLESTHGRTLETTRPTRKRSSLFPEPVALPKSKCLSRWLKVAVARARCLLACGCDYLLFKLVRNLTSMYCDPQTTCFRAVKGDQLCFELRLNALRLRVGWLDPAILCWRQFSSSRSGFGRQSSRWVAALIDALAPATETFIEQQSSMN